MEGLFFVEKKKNRITSLPHLDVGNLFNRFSIYLRVLKCVILVIQRLREMESPHSKKLTQDDSKSHTLNN